MKKLTFKTLLFLFLSNISINLLGQDGNYTLTPTNKTKFESLNRLLFIADSLSEDTIRLKVEDLYLQGTTPYVDIYYLVKIRLYSQNKNVNLSALQEKLSIDLIVNLEGDLIGGGNYNHIEFPTLEISPRVDLSTAMYHFNENNLSPFRVEALRKVEVKFHKNQLLDILGEGFLNDIQLEAFIDRGRYFKPASINIDPEFFIFDLNDTSNNLKKNEAILSWSQVGQPSKYEIEWIHIPNTSPSGVNTINFDFDNNATKLITKENFLPINLMYNNGFLVARGRTKRPQLNSLESGLTDRFIYSDWSLPTKGSINVSDLSVIIINNSITDEENLMNWQYRTNYLLDGKKKEVLSFYDGSSRNRQSNTILYDHEESTQINNTQAVALNSTIISTENYYDFNGNTVLTILPTPLIESKTFGYQKGINKLDSFKLKKADYDSLGYNPILALNSDSSGASNYYSPSNKLLGLEEKANYVPDANEYPYQKVEYLKDGSGRVKTIYGLGQDKALNSTKGNQFAYAKPDRKELEKLFGSNIGDISYYKKDIAIDPNGTMTAKYVNIGGKTVATALIGNSEGRSQMHNIPFNADQIVTNLITTGADKFIESENTYELNYPIFVEVSSLYKFKYGFDIEPYLACSNTNLCYDCRYEFIFQIIDEDNNLVLQTTDSLVNFNQGSCIQESYLLDKIDSLNPNYSATIVNNEIDITLSARKSYTIRKMLKLITDSIDLDSQNYLDSQECGILGYLHFENQELDQMDFFTCEEESTNSPNDFCTQIYENLRKDFLYPNGYFVSFFQSDSNSIYNKINESMGCLNTTPGGCYGDPLAFIMELKSQFGPAIFQGPAYWIKHKEAIASFLVKFHPNYCQYQICQDKYDEYSPFDRILDKSKNLDEFVRMAAKQKFIDLDSFNLLWDNTRGDEHYKAVHTITNQEFSTADMMILFDPVLQYNLNNPTDSLEKFEICNEGKKNGVGFYSKLVFNEFVRECDPKLDSFNRRDWYSLYFDYLMEGCHPDSLSPDSVSLYEAVKQVATSDTTPSIDKLGVDRKWVVFKGLYKNVRDNLMQDMLSSLVCVNPNLYNNDISCTPTDTTTYGVECDPYTLSANYNSAHPDDPPRPPSDFIDSCLYACDSINLGCESEMRQRFWNSPFYKTRPDRKTGEATYDSLKNLAFDSTANQFFQDTSLVNIMAGKQVYSLLLSDSCIISDSSLFVSTFNARQFVCNPFNYIQSEFGSIISNCELKMNNLASIQTSFLTMNMDSSGVEIPYFRCNNLLLQDDYTINELMQIHINYFVPSGESVPVVTNSSGINILDSTQKIYANLMNSFMGINLGFADYYYFIQDNTDDLTSNIFGTSFSWNKSTKSKELREVIVENYEDVRYNKLSEDSLFNNINKYLIQKNYDTLNRLSDIVGFGESSYFSGNNDLYYVENGINEFQIYLDSFNYVYNSIKQDLHNYSPLETSRNQSRYGFILQNLRYSSITNLPDLIIDRVGIYGNGTVWVRLLHASDSTYFEDYYYHYKPYTYYYGLEDIDTFKTITPVFDDESIEYVRLGFTAFNHDYSIIASKTKLFTNTIRIAKTLIGEGGNKPTFPLQKECEDLQYKDAIVNAKMYYRNYIDNIKEEFKLNYINFCIKSTSPNNALSNRNLKMSYASTARQFTLYYYDQADNLVMTVPPSGIDSTFETDSITELAFDAYRLDQNNIEPSIVPSHEKQTKYKYNSNNQIIEHSTPNGGTSNYWYDTADRLALSQNEKQKTINKFSYSRYDNQSRMYEVGETTLDILSGRSYSEIQAFILLGILDSTLLPLDTLIHQNQRNDVIKSYYDEAILDNNPTNFEQNNLRSRVATQAYYNLLDSNTVNTNWENAIHFSYDPIGNVTTTLNDYFQKGLITSQFQRFKRIDYKIDVVSGNILQVYYQLGKKDAIYHRYSYDASNRVTLAETSRDGLIWDEDANYDYYLHGPLSRTVLGNQKVQGLDYAYTLDGWLKSINGGHKSADIGKDFEKNNVFAEDAFGIALNYNQFDYEPIGGNSDFLANSNTGSSNSDLYNGNIAAITKHDQSRNYGKMYKYDQINRLKSMNEHSIDSTNLNWGGYLPDANSSIYHYDASGNITSLDRVDGASGQLMDKFEYNYIAGTDKLSSVDDDINNQLFPNDIDQQVDNNYAYDEIGNLVSDSAENICQIQWYPNGKVKRIIRDNPIKQKANLYFVYDGFGRRIKKTMSFVDNNQLFVKTTYYVRDAHGNVMATYNERDCNYYEGSDSLGNYNYQYSENYGYYTNQAIAQSNENDVLTYLKDYFSQKDELIESATDLANQIPHIRDSILEKLDVNSYIAMYPESRDRVISNQPKFYADYLFNNYFNSFSELVNDKREVWIQYHKTNANSSTFYSNLNSNYTAKYGANNYLSNYYSMNKLIVSDSLNNQTFIEELLQISSADYFDIVSMEGDYSFAINELFNLMIALDQELMNNNPGNPTPALINKINAALVTVSYSEDDMHDIFNSIDINNFYNALNWLTGNNRNRLNTILYHFNEIVDGYVQVSNLHQYKPTAVFNWGADSNGDLIQYFVHSDIADIKVFEGIEAYLLPLNLNNYNYYFLASNNVRPYVLNSMLRNSDDDLILTSLINNIATTKANLYSTESLNQLIHYFKTFHEFELLRLHNNNDNLNQSLGAINHITPISYAIELETNISGVDLGNLSNCSPYEVYMIAENHLLYGNNKIGIVKSKVETKDGENLYSRKLGAKNYEITDYLGNVVATVSDKKLHPQELVTKGIQVIDTTLGYQAEVTGRYDYYPFGMEIMSRSGNFETVDYSINSTELIYDGLLEDCADYSTTGGLGQNCTSSQNVYGQDYISYYEAGQKSKVSFKIFIDIKLSDVIADLNSNDQYKLDFYLDYTQFRPVSGKIGSNDGLVTSPSAGSGASENEITNARDKIISFNLTGDDLQSASVNGIVTLTITLEQAVSGEFEFYVLVDKIKIFKENYNTSTPLAKRKGETYPYGFNGMERDDNISGSGNSYDFGARIYNPRLGRWFSIDPLADKYPDLSPYNFVGNSPIVQIDKDGRDFEIYIDHNTKTIIIRATFISISNNSKTAALVSHGVEFLNSANGEFKYAVGRGKDVEFYDIVFEITDGADIEDESGQAKSVPNFVNDTPLDQIKKATDNELVEGISIRNNVYLPKEYVEENQERVYEIVEHEFGHSMGMIHSQSGRMVTDGKEKGLMTNNILAILGRAGFGRLRKNSVNVKLEALGQAKKVIEKGKRSPKFNKGRVLRAQKALRVQRRAMRNRKRANRRRARKSKNRSKK